MASVNQNREFVEHLMAGWPLDRAIDWIMTQLSPEDVFDKEALDAWAVEHGYVPRNAEDEQ